MCVRCFCVCCTFSYVEKKFKNRKTDGYYHHHHHHHQPTTSHTHITSMYVACMRVANFSTQAHESNRKSCALFIVLHCRHPPPPNVKSIVFAAAAAAVIAASELLCKERRILRKWKEKRRSQNLIAIRTHTRMARELN